MKPLEAWLQDSKVLISGDFDRIQSLHDRGYYGSYVGRELELSLYEALFLLEKGKIVVFDKIKRSLTINGFARKAKAVIDRFWTKFTVYRDLRSKGYIVKAALKFGTDFLVYDKGVKPDRGHSKWTLFVLGADEFLSARELAAMMRVAHGVKKQLLIAVVDSDQGVTYYSVGWEKVR